LVFDANKPKSKKKTLFLYLAGAKDSALRNTKKILN
jgi:hypothetical protein